MEFLLAALSLGLLGSFHCIGMCGPIALALPVNKTGKWPRVFSVFLYNLGRAFTYSVFGWLFGLLGKGFVLAGLQQGLSITLGLLILLAVFLPSRISQRFAALPVLGAGVVQLKNTFRHLFGAGTYAAALAVGVLNGFLPCGLVYMGVAGAIATGSALKGALFMFAFGMGTWPVMLVFTLGGQRISATVRGKVRKAVPVFIALSASLLILRGMNLNIPYVSPQINTNDCTKTNCCHKPR